jgi:hypothetical protein
LIADPSIRDAMGESSSGFHSRRGFSNRGDDVLVTGAATHRPLDPMPHLGLARVWIAIDQIVGGHDHAGRTESALQTVLVPERLLHGMQLPVGGQTLDRDHGRAVGLNGEDRARLDGLAIDEDRARAALAGVTADVGAGEAEVVAEKVHEEEARLDFRVLLRAVDGEGNGVLHADLRGGRELTPAGGGCQCRVLPELGFASRAAHRDAA